MAYSPLDTARPVVTGTRTAEIDKTRRNIVALRDMIAAIGMAPGFDYSIASGTAEQPTAVNFKRGSEWIVLWLTWGTTGGADGNVTKIVFWYTANAGGSYDGMADDAGKFVLSLAYDAAGNLSTTTWGSTP